MTAEPTTLVGTLARDPELRYTRDRVAVCSLTVVVDTPNPSAAPSTRQVVAYRNLAEHVALSVQSGDRVIVAGVPSVSSWTDGDGVERSGEIVVATAIGLDLSDAAAVPLRTQPRSVVVDDGEDTLGSAL